MPINKNELTREQITKAMACETAEDLMALVKAKGHEIMKEEAEACMAELAEIELDEATLQQVAGGSPKISDILKSTTAILMFL